ncbi:MAG: biotin/lipoyl-binding protein [Chloroflexota bacterium]|nr:biotin/lipoyl-binding protein [Chloroflexota bacterium]
MNLRQRVMAVLEAMRDLDLAELEIRIGSERVSLRRAGMSAARAPTDLPAAAKPDEPAGHLVRAPLAGTFFATPKPGDPAFVQVGQQIREGDLVGLVEAMKVFNEVLADVDGRVARILVRSGDGVAAGQPLLRVDADATTSGGYP